MRALLALLLSSGVAACSSAGAANPTEPDGGPADSAADSGTTAPDAADAFAPDTVRPGDAADSGDAAIPLQIAVSGNHFVDGSGKTIRLLGVDHSGTEYQCVHGFGIFDGPSDDAMIAAMASWHVNAVRVPLNEDCWLAINGVTAAYAGAAYRSAIADFVARLHAAHLYAILDLHWSAPGATSAAGQQPMANADHSPDFWRSVAATFAADRATIFDLYNEPYIDSVNAQTNDPWACWRDGCTITSGGWAAAGMQSLLDAVRSSGAKNVVMAGGLAYANDLSGWLAHKPSDPAGQLAASFHLYNFNACKTQSCWDTQVLPVAQQVPLVTGEIGEDDCGHTFIDGYMAWADTHGVSYLGWTWNPWDCAKGPALISDYGGTPTAFGLGFRDHVALVH